MRWVVDLKNTVVAKGIAFAKGNIVATALYSLFLIVFMAFFLLFSFFDSLLRTLRFIGKRDGPWQGNAAMLFLKRR